MFEQETFSWEEDEQEPQAVQRLVPVSVEFIDLAALEPPELIRLRQDRFRFQEAGIPSHTSRNRSFLAMAVHVRGRATNAQAGPGFEMAFDGNERTHQRIEGMRLYTELLRWRLTWSQVARLQRSARRGHDR